MISPAPAHILSPLVPETLPEHVPVAVQTRDGLVESVHHGSVIATAADGRTLFSAGQPLALFYPRSALKPLQAVAMVRAGLDLPDELLALAAASHSGASAHRDGALRILELHKLTPEHLENNADLPYGFREREDWLGGGGHATQLAQNCSGKHAAMAATCVINGWPVMGYLDPSHPLQRLVALTVADLTGEDPELTSTDGCGTPLFALTLRGMARAFGKLASTTGPGSAEASVASAMRQHPEMVAGEGRDVTTLMRLVPGLLAKDGFEGVQLVGLPDGRAVAVKISDGGDRARMPVTVRALAALDVDTSSLASLSATPVLGGGRPAGWLQATDFLASLETSDAP
ncbi:MULTISPECIES: asparaginase [unclassified Arthrobacter]|uniref:asparaginase n=1 Tax=unclassified Arthrobacter TaxID=235627 RepID=UPI002DFD10A1|nr:MULTISPECIES: asparaginase [unclassified Arthrobacter]MEC5193162.1 L-asparaginase II [Arthrobacter sp. MP_M4]MEC5202457.1 L-asparaginase II [Arthrobacter sp. MP_M7]